MMIKRILFRKLNNFWLFPVWKILHRQEAGILKNNKKYKNIHKGMRCFILGNGPSLKMEDLTVLSDEIVFTVNQFARVDCAREVKPNYHFWADSNFFVDDGSEASKEIIRVMKEIYTCNPNVVCFFPLEQRRFVEKHLIDKEMEAGYFKSVFLLNDHMKEAIDYSQFCMRFGTVVQWCIAMAIYMGFTEIYLLGCDNTGILTTIKSLLQKNDEDDYGYHYSEVEKKRMEVLLNKHSLEAYVGAYLSNIKEYRLLAEYCSSRGIRLVNCSAETAIDSIPRMKLNDVLEQ